jgi:tRNA G10  N-methylase Trm11
MHRERITLRILDATAGNRGIWFNKNHPLATYIDINPKVKPDIVMDCTKTCFPDKTFDLIVFDPPHIGSSSQNKGIITTRYGHLRANEIRRLIYNAFKEFNRILKDGGFVLFKWNDHDQKLDKILGLVEDFEPLFGQRVAIRTKHS